MLGLAARHVAVGVGVGYAWGGPDRGRSARTAALTAIPVASMLFVDRVMQSLAGLRQQPGDQRPSDRHDRHLDAEPRRATSGSRRSTRSRHLLLPTIALC